jgi:DNA-directed RNA polymerase specialized sigma24 family protein
VVRAGNPDAYVRRIVINENNNRFRKRRVREISTDNLPETSIPGIDLVSRAALLGALKILGPRQRAVIVLRYWLDLTDAETATCTSSLTTSSRQSAPHPHRSRQS